MKTEIFTLCDSAADTNGKLNIGGSFDSIYVKQAPAVVPQCAVALRLRCEKRDEGKHIIKLSIADKEGRTLCTLAESPFEVAVPAPAPSNSISMSLAINGMNISQVGVYSIELHIDGRLVEEIPLHVFQVLPPKN